MFKIKSFTPKTQISIGTYLKYDKGRGQSDGSIYKITEINPRKEEIKLSFAWTIEGKIDEMRNWCTLEEVIHWIVDGTYAIINSSEEEIHENLRNYVQSKV